MSKFDFATMMPTDTRAPRGGWAPGMYTCECKDCGAGFLGAKRSVECATCAYSWIDTPQPLRPGWLDDDAALLEAAASTGTEFLTTGDVLADLRHRVEDRGAQKELADDLGISAAYMNDIVHERRDISREFAEKLGYRRVVVFVPIDEIKGAAP
jgi:hypothetical protein